MATRAEATVSAALAERGELEKWLPAFEPPPDSSTPLAEEVELLDRHNFDQKA
jgi:hypothetical protein